MSQQKRRVENELSTLLTLEENQQISLLLGARCKTLATTIIQLFHTQQGTLKKETGVLCFVKDNTKRNYFFRLFCLQRNCMIWEQKIYPSMVYSNTCPNLHTFQGSESMIAFNFVNEEEANELYKNVTALFLRQKKREEQRSANNTIGSSFSPMIRSATLELTSFSPNPDMAEQKRNITKADIGPPLEFRHISHVGFNYEEEGFTFNTNDEQLHDFLLKNMDTANFIYDFIRMSGGRDVIERSFTKKPTSPPSPLLVTPPRPQSQPPGAIMAEEKKAKRKGSITKADIGHPFEFRHISHVGWHHDKAFAFSTEDKHLNEFFHKAGVSEKDLQDSETRKFIYDFLEKNGVHDVIQGNITKKPPPPTPTVQTGPHLPSKGGTETIHNITDPSHPSATPQKPQPQPRRGIVNVQTSPHLSSEGGTRTVHSVTDPSHPSATSPKPQPQPRRGIVNVQTGPHVPSEGGTRSVHNITDPSPPSATLPSPPPHPPREMMNGIRPRPPKNAPPPRPPGPSFNGSPPLESSAPPTPPLPPPLTKLPPPVVSPSTNDNQGYLHSFLLGSIREGIALKSVDSEQKNNITRGYVFSDIRKGVMLKRIGEKEMQPATPNNEGVDLANTLKRALFERNRLIHPDDDDASNTNSDDDEWR